TASLGRLIGDTGIYGNYFVAVILLIFGLYLMDIIALPWNGKLFNNGNRKGIYSALIMGILFGAGLGPCTFAFMAPVLGVVFQSANSDFYLSASLLLAFGAGHCSVIVAAGTFTKKLQIFMNWTEDSMVVIYIKRICGALVILGGIYMIYRSI
ncbi:MAG TPA: cytochrome c biogenesis protein CcdA, partial [Ignavibacteria bacterium]|nr:cytochrome c biogenesis protein CcdA [Ignavibacteria bacterium]